MSAMATRWSLLARLRRHRRAGITLFVLLLLLVAAERRVADLHLNQRTAAPAFEGEAVEGDEVRVSYEEKEGKPVATSVEMK
jgi:hypothetical protein